MRASRSRRPMPRSWRWSLVALAAVGVWGVASVFWALTHAVAGASSAARVPVPSTKRIELDARTYAVSYALAEPTREIGREANRLHVSITPAADVGDDDAGRPLGFHDPTRRGIFSSPSESVLELHFVDVPRSGPYDVTTTVDGAPVHGSLVIGDSPSRAPVRALMRLLVVLAVAGCLAIAVPIVTSVRIRRG